MYIHKKRQTDEVFVLKKFYQSGHYKTHFTEDQNKTCQ